jgi:outer membrane protein assembly factor BamB
MKPVILAMVFMVAAVAYSADWPQWRGPDGNGIATQSPPLVEAFFKDTLKKAWESEPIPSGLAGGWASVVVAGGKAYVYVNNIPRYKWRMVSEESLASQGYRRDMSAELLKKVEDARTGTERKAVKDDTALAAWVDKWIAANLTETEAKFKDAVRLRLSMGTGPEAVKLEGIEKIAAVIDRKFDTSTEWSKWLKESGIETNDAVNALSDAGAKVLCDYVYCLDAATGKTLWKARLPGAYSYYPNSSTPTVSGGRIYLLNSGFTLYCLDAADGKEIWHSPVLGRGSAGHPRTSCPLVGEGVAAVVTPGDVKAIDLTNGQIAWTTRGVASEFSSGTFWPAPDKTYFLMAAGGRLTLIDPKTGKSLASAKGGTYGSTAVVAGEFAAAPSGTELRGYRLTNHSVDQIWAVPFAKEQFASALIFGDHVFALGGGEAGWKEEHKGRALCVELKTGKVAWDEPLPTAEHSSPIVADGKIIAVVGTELVCIKATPEKLQILGRADLGLEANCSPAFVNGKVFLRTATHVVCYDLAKP